MNFTLARAALALSACGFALAMTSPAEALQTPTTGQPGAPAGVTCQNLPATPGHSAANSGSPFGPSGQSGNVYAGNPGTASLAHANSTAAVSNYDVACRNVSAH